LKILGSKEKDYSKDYNKLNTPKSRLLEEEDYGAQWTLLRMEAKKLHGTIALSLKIMACLQSQPIQQLLGNR